MKKFLKYIILLILFVNIITVKSFSADKEPEKEYQLQRYDDIKRKQEKEFKKGVYNDNNKDYVGGWIGEDINYQKKAIKLKKDYRTWAADKISKKEPVVFEEYAKNNKLNRVEKQILLEYHNKFYRIEEEKKPVVLAQKKSINKKAAKAPVRKPEKSEPLSEPAFIIKAEVPAAVMRNKENNRIKYYIFLAAILLASVSSAAIIFRVIKNYKLKSGKMFFQLNKNTNQ